MILILLIYLNLVMFFYTNLKIKFQSDIGIIFTNKIGETDYILKWNTLRATRNKLNFLQAYLASLNDR